MAYGNVTWAMIAEQIKMRILLWMCSVSLMDKVPSVELRERLGIELITKLLRRIGLGGWDTYYRKMMGTG